MADGDEKIGAKSGIDGRTLKVGVYEITLIGAEKESDVEIDRWSI